MDNALRKEAAADAVRVAYQALRSDFITAAFDNPLTEIRTPGFGEARMRLVDVVSDMLDANADLHLLERIVSLIVACSEGDDPATRLPGNALLMCMAHHYANFHADDAAAEDYSHA
jgi:hypothetical protein